MRAVVRTSGSPGMCGAHSGLHGPMDFMKTVENPGGDTASLLGAYRQGWLDPRVALK